MKFSRKEINVFLLINIGILLLVFMFLLFQIDILLILFDPNKISKFIYTHWYVFFLADLILKTILLNTSVDQLKLYRSLLIKKNTLGNYYVLWNCIALDNFVLLFFLLPLIFGMITSLGAFKTIVYLLVALILAIANRFLLLITTLLSGIRFMTLLLVPLLYYAIQVLDDLLVFGDPYHNIIYSGLFLIFNLKWCHFLILKKTNL